MNMCLSATVLIYYIIYIAFHKSQSKWMAIHVRLRKSLSLSHNEMFPGMDFKAGPAGCLGQLGDS